VICLLLFHYWTAYSLLTASKGILYASTEPSTGEDYHWLGMAVDRALEHACEPETEHPKLYQIHYTQQAHSVSLDKTTGVVVFPDLPLGVQLSEAALEKSREAWQLIVAEEMKIAEEAGEEQEEFLVFENRQNQNDEEE
jgi:hypothetical protein